MEIKLADGTTALGSVFPSPDGKEAYVTVYGFSNIVEAATFFGDASKMKKVEGDGMKISGLVHVDYIVAEPNGSYRARMTR